MSYISPTVSILSEFAPAFSSSSNNNALYLVGGTTTSSRLALGRQIVSILALLANSGLYFGNTADLYLGAANPVQPLLNNITFTSSSPTKTTPDNATTTSPSLSSGGRQAIFQVAVFALVIILAAAYGVMITIKRSQRRHKRPIEESVKPPYSESQIVPPSDTGKDGNNKENGRTRVIGRLPPASCTARQFSIAQAPSAPPPPSQPPTDPNPQGTRDQGKKDKDGSDKGMINFYIQHPQLSGLYVRFPTTFWSLTP